MRLQIAALLRSNTSSTDCSEVRNRWTLRSLQKIVTTKWATKQKQNFWSHRQRRWPQVFSQRKLFPADNKGDIRSPGALLRLRSVGLRLTKAPQVICAVRQSLIFGNSSSRLRTHHASTRNGFCLPLVYGRIQHKINELCMWFWKTVANLIHTFMVKTKGPAFK